MGLYQKYRPQSFDGILGNTDTIASLKKMVESKEVPHAMLFQGDTGCGKTTLARILAKELGCSANDYKEIDTADFRGIETVRSIREQISYKPLEGEVRVWVIDECHKMTNDAQNALLKILEDTPKHVYLILCTTDPQKLIKTIKGRCSVFEVSNLNEKHLSKLLRKTARNEGESLSSEVLDQIIMDSQNRARNALQILEQVLNVEEDKRLEMAKRSAESQSQSIELCRLLIGEGTPWKKVASVLNGLKDTEDSEAIRRHVLAYTQSVLLNKDNPTAGLILEEFIEPFYASGFPGLVYACYSVINNK